MTLGGTPLSENYGNIVPSPRPREINSANLTPKERPGSSLEILAVPFKALTLC